MKEELGTWGAVVGAAVLACLFGGLVLAIYPGWGVTYKTLFGPEFPWGTFWTAASAVGTCAAVVVSLQIAGKQARDQDAARIATAEIAIRFNSELLTTNEGLLRVALVNLPEPGKQVSFNAESETRLAIAAIRAMSQDDIKSVIYVDADLAQHLADFHCALQTLNGILERNPARPLLALSKSVKGYLERLEVLAMQIRERTVS